MAVVVAILLILFTQTGFFRSWLRDKIVVSANESINGELAIESLDGNVFTNVTLSGVSIQMDGDTVASVGQIHLRYDLWKLVNQIVQIDSLVIDSAHVSLIQLADSTWNLAQIALTDTSGSVPVDTTQEAIGYDIVVSDFILGNSAIDIVATDSLIPRRVEGLNVHLAGEYAGGQIGANLYDFRLRTVGPDFTVNHAECSTAIDSVSIAVTDFLLETALNRITASGQFYPDASLQNRASLTADSVDLSEFRRFIPVVARDPLPMIFLYANVAQDSLWLTLSAERGDQRIDIEADMKPLTSVFDTSAGEPLRYLANVVFDKVMSTDWTTDTALTLTLNGAITVEGSGLEPQSAVLRVEGDFENSLINEYALTKFGFGIDYAGADCHGVADRGG